MLRALAWGHGEPLGDPCGGWGGGATTPRQLLLRQSSLLLPGAASTFLPSRAKKLWQYSAMHCLSEGCWCPGVRGCVRVCVLVCVCRADCVGAQGCVCMCVKMSLGECSWSHETTEAGWL